MPGGVSGGGGGGGGDGGDGGGDGGDGGGDGGDGGGGGSGAAVPSHSFRALLAAAVTPPAVSTFATATVAVSPSIEHTRSAKLACAASSLLFVSRLES